MTLPAVLVKKNITNILHVKMDLTVENETIFRPFCRPAYLLWHHRMPVF